MISNKLFLSGFATVALISSAASADVTISFTGLTLAGYQFAEAITPGQINGTLTGATINVEMIQSSWFTKANDLTLYLDVAPLSSGGLLQIGGAVNSGAAERRAWPTGGGLFSTTSTGRVDLHSAINLANHPNMSFWIGNGRESYIASGTWTGSIVLHGVSLVGVPSPGAIALLAVSGIVARRRRA